MSALTEFLFPAPAGRTTKAIVVWWERRRLAYNAWVGAAGLVSVGMITLASLVLGGGFLIGPPLIGAGIFAAMANVCYLIGPTTELFIDKLWGRQVLPTGPTLYRAGLTFSVGLALFPALLTVIALAVGFVAGIL
jgi:hypothetical protein